MASSWPGTATRRCGAASGEIIFDRKALDWAGLMAELDDTAPAEVLAGLARYQ